MAKDNRVYIEHMLECIQNIHEYIDCKESFFSTRLIQDAVVRNLQIMAESSQRLSDDLKSQYDFIPWRAISGFRNILVHDYLGVDLDVIWSVIEQDVPALEKALEAMLAKDS